MPAKVEWMIKHGATDLTSRSLRMAGRSRDSLKQDADRFVHRGGKRAFSVAILSV